MQEIVYLAGPLRSDPPLNIKRAAIEALKLWQAGVPVICPHLNSGQFLGLIDEGTVLAGYLNILSMCNAVITFADWRNSKGTRVEVRCALELHIPVYHSVEGYLETRRRFLRDF